MLDAFSFMFLVFGLALVATAVQLFRHRDEDPSVDDNVLVIGGSAAVTGHQPSTTVTKLVTRREGRRVLTPLFLVLVAIGSTDVLFALDSIPAVFGVTQHAYIVFVANAFALLGLRALFFLVSGLLDRLVYLSTGLALILGFIGVKLVLHFAAPAQPRRSPRSRLGSRWRDRRAARRRHRRKRDQGSPRPDRSGPCGPSARAPQRRPRLPRAINVRDSGKPIDAHASARPRRYLWHAQQM